jgi:hypothetical protein
MAWIIFITLSLFYFLGLFVFHATGPVHVLPFVAVAVPLLDRFLSRRSKNASTRSNELTRNTNVIS